VHLLCFSDLHRDLDQAQRLVELSAQADAVIAAGDFASVHEGLSETVEVLSGIEAPTVVVAGNNETADATRDACAGWRAATVLHGETSEIDGVQFFGLGAGIPVTPWAWSFDLSDDEAAGMLRACPDGAFLVVHSPPYGHCDVSGSGEHLGSTAILETIELKRPPVAVCGHIHESWGSESKAAGTRILNLGPEGTWIKL
jgi:Icc-related predicted phosphoesterase